jgi:GNAT superfamily N-acetyltransferase
MAAANQATRDAAGIQGRIDIDMMRSQYSHLVNSDPGQDIVILEAAGEVVGYARVDWNDQTDGTRELGLVALTRAGWTGRGLERLLVAWADARRAEIGQGLASPGGPSLHLGAFTFDGEPALAGALVEAGYTVADRAYEMERSPLDDIVLEPVPEGLEVRAGRQEDIQSVWEAMVESFRDHPGEIEDSEEDYRRFLDHPRFDPASWIVAVEDGQVCGGILTDVDPQPAPNRAGWLEEVFVRRPWRRRGLARAMIGRALIMVRERGATRALLGVAGANPNQAMSLYESAGFRVVSSSSRWTKPFATEEPHDG